MTSCQTVSPSALGQGGSCTILDVRTPAEHRGLALDLPHCHVPLDRLDVPKFILENGLSADHPVYVLCRSGGRAARAAQAFMEAGYPNVHVIEGGIMACADQGIGTVKGNSGVISLERQVRIAAGTLVLLGVIFGTFFIPAFYGLSAFVGAGLVFAGITDWCGMGLLLARMPWNK